MTATAERYARAVCTTNLRAEGDSPHADIIIAAGTATSLGTMLARLRSEFDTTNREELKHADKLTARVLTLISLQSLDGTKRALGRFALERAAQRLPSATEAQVCKIVGQVLDVWLDPGCHACEGRGFNGGFGIPKLMCTECRGSQVRLGIAYGVTEAEDNFGRWLTGEMDRRVAKAMGQIKHKTRDA